MKLTPKQHILLCEALRRYTRHYKGKDLVSSWTGFGSMTEYKPCLSAGLMDYATTPNPGHLVWWKLTPRGAAIVGKWLSLGFDFTDIEKGNVPNENYS
jgi:hypothetical protein